MFKALAHNCSPELFQELALKAKEGCPISKLFNCEITLEAALV